MKIAFVFDMKFIFYKDEYYAVDLPREIWIERYLRYCDELKVIGRREEVAINPSPRIGLSSMEGVSFDCLKNESYIFRVLHKKTYSRHVSEAIADCDFVICRGSWGVSECKKQGKPYLIEVVGCQWDALWNHSLSGKMVALPRFLTLRKAVRNAPYVVYVTKQFLQRRYPTNGKSIGVSDVRLVASDNSVLEKRIQKYRNRNVHDMLIIGTTAATNVKYKGQQYVIKALGKLKKQGNTSFEYQIVGAGDCGYLQRVAKSCGVLDQVVFKGPLPHAEIFRWIDTIDLYVQPSLQEGLPRAVVEAMSRACPVLGSSTGGIPELVSDTMIFKRKGVGHIADKLLLLNKETLLVEAERNFFKAQEYNVDKLNSQRNDFYLRSIRESQ